MKQPTYKPNPSKGKVKSQQAELIYGAMNNGNGNGNDNNNGNNGGGNGNGNNGNNGNGGDNGKGPDKDKPDNGKGPDKDKPDNGKDKDNNGKQNKDLTKEERSKKKEEAKKGQGYKQKGKYTNRGKHLGWYKNRLASGEQIEVTYYLNDVSDDLSQVLMTYNDDGVYDTAYTYGTERIGIDILDNTRPDSQNPLYYLYDGQGSVSYITKPDGEIRDTYKYDEFGKPKTGKLSPDGDKILHTSFGYTGEQWDEESRLQYLRARYYDPEVGRFINRDTYQGEVENPLSKNLFVYVENNPLKFVDPSGHKVEILIYGFNGTDSLTGHGGIKINGTVYTFYPSSGPKFQINSKQGRLYKFPSICDAVRWDTTYAQDGNSRALTGYEVNLTAQEEIKIKSYVENKIKNKRPLHITKKTGILGKDKNKYPIRGEAFTIDTPYNLTSSNCIQFALNAIASGISEKKYEDNKDLFNSYWPGGIQSTLDDLLKYSEDDFILSKTKYN